MEIGPVSAIRPVAMVKPSPDGADLSAVFEIELRKEAGDDRFSQSGQSAERGLKEEDAPEEAAAGLASEGQEPDDRGRTISFIA